MTNILITPELFYDRDWNHLDFSLKFPQGRKIAKPDKFEEMLSLAEKLAEGFSFIRIDLYNCMGSVFLVS